MALLRELPLTQGTFKIGHPSSSMPLKIAYSSQSPWIFAGSIRDNILFGERYDEKRFHEVIRVCELERDLSLFARGEHELIGEKGVTLSGGQRARVSLARATYSQADLYILDDPLSAVDPSVGRNLFNNCIRGYMGGKPRILVTHQLQYIKDCDRVLVLERGKATHYGPIAQVMKAEVEEEGEGAGTSHKRFVDVLREFAADEVVADTNSIETVIEYLEKNDNGEDVSLETMKTMEIDEETEEYSAKKNNMVTEDRADGNMPLSIYWVFFRSGSSVPVILLMASCLVLGQAFSIMTDWYISNWSSQDSESQRQWSNAAIYVALAIATIIVSTIRALWFFSVMLDSSSNIFRRMLDAVLRTSISFFNTQPHGRVLNVSLQPSFPCICYHNNNHVYVIASMFINHFVLSPAYTASYSVLGMPLFCVMQFIISQIICIATY
ncbi:P-loop containing nucleoside triphosphate hydrolase protein [Jimgerdemannia flammicorona]|uniref:P-loop containing nucleoside triphosphate hydrolase protein n=1 Tax=Jimgerdemannia flammicorona TaxID=994334 RepID=A0A433QHE6_9FUNG|nr:P-loop containing nucleoside triphosphate hydrolase protein [Jimgerdemannia flammicorona]